MLKVNTIRRLPSNLFVFAPVKYSFIWPCVTCLVLPSVKLWICIYVYLTLILKKVKFFETLETFPGFGSISWMFVCVDDQTCGFMCRETTEVTAVELERRKKVTKQRKRTAFYLNRFESEPWQRGWWDLFPTIHHVFFPLFIHSLSLARCPTFPIDRRIRHTFTASDVCFHN